LESLNVADKLVIIVEIKINNQWPSDLLFGNSDKLKTENRDKVLNGDSSTSSELNKANNNNKFFYGKGIINIGNTCYMNSVLQTLMNLDKLKAFLDDKYFSFWINRKNKYGFNGKIISEFLILYREYHLRSKEPVKPHKLKAAIGEVNSQFKNLDQQDSQEFLSYLIDVLHEELNINSEKEYIPNPESYDGTEEQLSGEFWANNLRRNASFIHSLFLGQMKSTLTCAKCNIKKITYETFTSLNIPIPQKKTILLNIIIHRIPFTYKAYYFEHYAESNNSSNNNRNKNLTSSAAVENEDMKKKEYEVVDIRTINPRKNEEEKQKEYFDINQSPEHYFEKRHYQDERRDRSDNYENKNNINAVMQNKDENSLELNLENISGLTVRDKLNFLRKESYEKIKLISKNLWDDEDYKWKELKGKQKFHTLSSNQSK